MRHFATLRSKQMLAAVADGLNEKGLSPTGVIMEAVARAAIRVLPGRMEPPLKQHRAAERSLPVGIHARWSAVVAGDGQGRIGGSFRGRQTVFCSWCRGSGLV
jgi:hypothetical protein